MRVRVRFFSLRCIHRCSLNANATAYRDNSHGISLRPSFNPIAGTTERLRALH